MAKGGEATEGTLVLSDGLRTWYRISGNSNGIPVVVLHGGPGYHSDDDDLRFFDLALFSVVQYDQRGCGRTEPRAHKMTRAELDKCTCAQLVADLEEVRVAVVGKQRPWVVFGASWGSALAIMYAAAHPTRVLGLLLHGVYAGSPAEHAPLFDEKFAEARDLLAVVVPDAAGLWDDPVALHAAYHASVENAAAADPATATRALLLWEQYENFVTYPAQRRHFLRQMRETLSSGGELSGDPTDIDQALLQLRLFPQMMAQPPLTDPAIARKLTRIPVAIVHGLADDVCPPFVARALVSALEATRAKVDDSKKKRKGPNQRLSVQYRFIANSSHMAEDDDAVAALREMANWLWTICMEL